MMAYNRPSDWLADLDSHSLYSVDLLESLPGVTVRRDTVPGAGGGPIAVLYRDDHKGTPVRVSLQTLGEVKERPGKAGVTLWEGYNPQDLVFSGFYIAARLALLFLGDSPGSAKLGRGSAYKVDLAALYAAGF